MNIEQHQKVTASQLKREAYLYVRQSTLRQVFENTESTKRQYALKERGVALGWPLDRVVVIDSDLGQSGAAPGREGFQKLAWAGSASCSASKSRGWPATRPTGTACSRSVR